MKGWTLLELVVAVGILMILLPATYSLLRYLQTSLYETVAQQEGLFLCGEAIEQFGSSAYQDVMSGSFADGKGEVKVEEVKTGLKQLSVLFYWNDNRSPITLVTYIAAEGS